MIFKNNAESMMSGRVSDHSDRMKSPGISGRQGHRCTGK